MRSALSLTPENFEALLAWLDPDRDAAGRKYEVIRSGLVRIFVSKGLSDAESMADEVINRVAARVPEIGPGYVGEPAAYFRGVARNLLLESWRRKEVATDNPPERHLKPSEPDDEYECLLRCLKFLPREKRELVLDYHAYEGADKIATHRAMAQELSVSENALRIQAHRLRARLEQCVTECVRSLRGKRIPARESLYEKASVLRREARER
jgi:DNA-directed RNA polymerase specialized sigma24 family protein